MRKEINMKLNDLINEVNAEQELLQDLVISYVMN